MYGLIKLHARLAGRRDKKNLAHVRAIIKIVEPDFDMSAIRPKKCYRGNTWFKRGEMFPAALRVLRTASEPLTQNEIALRMLSFVGVDSPDAATRRIVRNAIKNTLPKYRGTVLELSEGKRWSIK